MPSSRMSGCVAVGVSSGMVMRNVLPRPLPLSTSMLPASRRTDRSTIDSPRPKPSTPAADSSRTKLSNIRLHSSALMPHPVSVTLMHNSPPRMPHASVTVPREVNFRALDSRLSTMRRMRIASLMTVASAEASMCVPISTSGRL